MPALCAVQAPVHVSRSDEVANNACAVLLVATPKRGNVANAACDVFSEKTCW